MNNSRQPYSAIKTTTTTTAATTSSSSKAISSPSAAASSSSAQTNRQYIKNHNQETNKKINRSSIDNTSDSSVNSSEQVITSLQVNSKKASPEDKQIQAPAPAAAAAAPEDVEAAEVIPLVAAQSINETTTAAAASRQQLQTQQQPCLPSPCPPAKSQSVATNQVKKRKNESRNYVLDPSGSVYYHWSMVVSFAFLYNFWSLSYRFAFREIDYDTMASWFALDYSADFIYMLDIVINSRTGYLEDGVLQQNVARVRNHYKECTIFYLDCLCLLPLDILYLSFGFNSILRCARLVKIYKFWSYVDRTERHTNYPNVFRTFALVHYILVIFHWNACLFHMISKNNIIDIQNLYKINDNRCHDTLCQYLHAFYWSTLKISSLTNLISSSLHQLVHGFIACIGQALTAIGDLPRPRTKGEYIYVTVELILGLFLFASVLGHVANIVTNVSAARKEFQAKLDAVKTFMRMRRVSDELQNKVIQWFDYLWISQQSSDEDKSVACLPDRLKAEIAIHVHLDTLKRVDIFQNTEAGFLCELVLRLKPVLFSPGDYVCRKNEVGHEMYIVSRGILEVVTDNGKSVVATLMAGSYFGEISVLNVGLAGNKRTASVRSVGYSDLFCLNKQDLWDVLKNYPNAEARIRARAEERLSKLDINSSGHQQTTATTTRKSSSQQRQQQQQQHQHKRKTSGSLLCRSIKSDQQQQQQQLAGSQFKSRGVHSKSCGCFSGGKGLPTTNNTTATNGNYNNNYCQLLERTIGRQTNDDDDDDNDEDGCSNTNDKLVLGEECVCLRCNELAACNNNSNNNKRQMDRMLSNFTRYHKSRASLNSVSGGGGGASSGRRQCRRSCSRYVTTGMPHSTKCQTDQCFVIYQQDHDDNDNENGNENENNNDIGLDLDPDMNLDDIDGEQSDPARRCLLNAHFRHHDHHHHNRSNRPNNSMELHHHHRHWPPTTNNNNNGNSSNNQEQLVSSSRSFDQTARARQQQQQQKQKQKQLRQVVNMVDGSNGLANSDESATVEDNNCNRVRSIATKTTTDGGDNNNNNNNNNLNLNRTRQRRNRSTRRSSSAELDPPPFANSWRHSRYPETVDVASSSVVHNSCERRHLYQNQHHNQQQRQQYPAPDEILHRTDPLSRQQGASVVDDSYVKQHQYQLRGSATSAESQLFASNQPKGQPSTGYWIWQQQQQQQQQRVPTRTSDQMGPTFIQVPASPMRITPESQHSSCRRGEIMNSLGVPLSSAEIASRAQSLSTMYLNLQPPPGTSGSFLSPHHHQIAAAAAAAARAGAGAPPLSASTMTIAALPLTHSQPLPPQSPLYFGLFQAEHQQQLLQEQATVAPSAHRSEQTVAAGAAPPVQPAKNDDNDATTTTGSLEMNKMRNERGNDKEENVVVVHESKVDPDDDDDVAAGSRPSE